MGRDIDSGALGPVQKQLGYSGSAGQFTDFDENDLLQSFEVNSAVRRGRADVATGGWFYGRLDNRHIGNDTVFSFIDPYAPGANALGTWPQEVPQDFDVWIGHIWAFGDTAAGNFAEALCSLGLPARMQAMGADESQNPLAATSMGMTLGYWDTQQDISTVEALQNSKTDQVIYAPKMRLPRGVAIQFMSRLGGAGGDVFSLGFELGLFPIGMGQDVGY